MKMFHKLIQQQRVHRLCLLLFFMGQFSLSASAQTSHPTAASQPRSKWTLSPSNIESLFAARNFKGAITYLQSYLKQTHPNTAKDKRLTALYHLQRAQFFAARYKASIDTAKQWLQHTTHDPRTTQVWMLRAMAHSKLKQFEKTHRIYAKHIKVLLSARRDIGFSKIFLKHAQKHIALSKLKQKRYHTQKSIVFLKYALQHKLPDAMQRDIRLKILRLYMRAKQNYAGYRYAFQTARKYPSGKHAETFLYILTQTSLKRGLLSSTEREIARFKWTFPRSKWLPNIYALQAAVTARSYISKTQKKKRLLEIWQSISKHFPTHALARKALFQIAYIHYQNRAYTRAQKAFRRVVTTFSKLKKPTSSTQKYITQAHFYIGECLRLMQHYPQAIEAFRGFLKQYPTSPKWSAVQKKIIQIQYAQAMLYIRNKKWKRAHQALTQFVARYPLHRYSRMSMLRLGELFHVQKKYKQAIQMWKKIAQTATYKREGKQARWNVAQTYEEHLHEYTKALDIYRSFRSWRWRKKARRAIRRLQRKALHLHIPRVFKIHEKATLEIKTRNVAQAQVRMYIIDAETYFRKMHRFSGMEKLDFQLIRPNKTWNIRIPKMRKYHVHTTRVQLPSDRPIVAVLHATSGKLKATTVALISRIQLVSKVRSNALFVYVQDNQTQRPLAHARILVSNTKSIVLEGKTNARGIFRIHSKKVPRANQLKLLALAQQSVAFGHTSLSTYGTRKRIRDAYILYTDRTRYQRKQTLHVQGVLRTVKHSNYVVPKGLYTLHVLNPHGKTAYKSTVHVDARGVFSKSFYIHPEDALGHYTIQLREGHYIRASRRVYVQQPKTSLYNVAIQFKQTHIRGTQWIEGHVRATYAWGAVLPNKTIQYNLSGLRGTGQTNAQGVWTFRLPSYTLKSGQKHTLYVRLQGTAARARLSLWKKAVHTHLQFLNRRTVFVEGEPIQLQLRVFNPLTTQSRRVDIRWFRKEINAATSGRGKAAGKQIFQVARKNTLGVRRTGLKSGLYTVVAKLQDPQGNDVEKSYTFRILKKAYRSKLQLVAPQTHVRVGMKLPLYILSNVTGTALITYESGRVIRHTVLKRIRTGITKLPLHITSDLVPDFAVRVLLLSKQKAYQSSVSFTVRPRLHISLVKSHPTYRPGDWVQLKIQTKNGRGQGVASHVSVGLVSSATASSKGLFASKLYTYKREGSTRTFVSSTYKASAGHIVELKPQKFFHLGSRVAFHRPSSTPPAPQQRIWRSRRRRHRNLQWRRRLQRNIHVGNAPTSSASSSLISTVSTPPRTLYWNPSVQTDATGQATVRFQIPHDASGVWRLSIRGVSAPSLLGELHQTWKLHAPIEAQLYSPQHVVSGDLLSPVVRLSNRVCSKTIRVTARLLDGTQHVWRQTFKLKSGQTKLFSSISWRLSARTHSKGVLRLVVDYTLQGKRYTRTLSRPYQIHTKASPWTWSSSQTGQGTHVFSLPSKRFKQPSRARLELRVALFSKRWLLALTQHAARLGDPIQSTWLYRLSLLDVALSQLKHLKENSTSKAKELHTQLKSTIRFLVQAQSPRGGWNPIYAGRTPRYKTDPHFSVQVLAVLLRISKQYKDSVPLITIRKARAYIKRSYARLLSNRLKADYLTVLAQHTQSDRPEIFSYLNRLFRMRHQLKLSTLAHLGLALHTMQRSTLAKALLPIVLKGLGSHDWSAQTTPQHPSRFHQIVSIVSYLQTVFPKHPLVRKGLLWLLKQRTHRLWSSPRKTQKSLELLGMYMRSLQASTKSKKLRIQYGTRPSIQLHLDTRTGGAFSRLYTWELQPPFKRLKIESKDPGLYDAHVQIIGTPKVQPVRRSKHYTVKRSYQPSLRRVKGQLLRPGFTYIRKRKKGTKLRRTVRNIRLGKYTRVRISIRRLQKNSTDHVVVDEPIPAGTYVSPSSIHVSRGRYLLLPQGIRFYLEGRRSQWNIRYRLYGTLYSKSTALETHVRTWLKPHQKAKGQPHTLTFGINTGRPLESYDLTPNELYQAGLIYARTKQWKQAVKSMQTLLQMYQVKTHILPRIYKVLLSGMLAHGSAQQQIHFFERLKEIHPNASLSLTDVRTIAEAYSQRKEYERSAVLYRVLLQTHFLNELQISARLERTGKHIQSSRFTHALYTQYPAFKIVQKALYALAQTAFQQAHKNKRKKRIRMLWLRRAEELFRTFIQRHPRHPEVDKAAYTLANVWMEQKKREQASLYLEKIAQRYPNSTELDSMHYLHAYALYLKRKSLPALELLQHVSTAHYLCESKTLKPSKHRYLARYLMAQIHHTNLDLTRALRYYEKVKSKFPDAATQVQHLKKTVLSFHEITTVDGSAPAVLRIRHRNIRSVVLRAYRVDLMKLYLLKKNLNNVTRINLAGIHPTYKKHIRWGTRSEFKEKVARLHLPLPQRGAYLVVLKSKNKEVSGILLRTQLKLDVEQNPSTGRVTAYVFDRKTQRPVHQAWVRVVATKSRGKIHKGRSDLRGILSVQNARGYATVLAQKGDDFAFFRGRVLLNPPSSRRTYQFSDTYIQGRRRRRYKRRRRYRRRTGKSLAPNMLKHIEKNNFINSQSGRKQMLELYQQNKKSIQLNALE